VRPPVRARWDVRLQPRYGTVGVCIIDGQTRVEVVAALVALVQSLARLEFERPCGPEEELTAVEVIEENRFLAARDGMEALLIDVDSGERLPATEQLELVLGACHRHAELLGCGRELAALWPLAAETAPLASSRGPATATCDRSPPTPRRLPPRPPAETQPLIPARRAA
jgi:gamma-glutamyl:cysteine ligase YbdK (ATP-grasp superfamily)